MSAHDNRKMPSTVANRDQPFCDKDGNCSGSPCLWYYRSEYESATCGLDGEDLARGDKCWHADRGGLT